MFDELNNIKILYFGSYDNDITEISTGKFLTTFKAIACCFAIPINDIYGDENSGYLNINFGYDIWSKSEVYLNKQEIPKKIKITNNAKDWIKTSGKSFGYLYSVEVDDYLLNHLEKFNDSNPKWEIVYNGKKKLPVKLINNLILNWECEYSPIKSKQSGGYAIPLDIDYERPYTYAKIKEEYGKQIADKLYKDPVHRWRMNTGIELIHKEPDLEEQKRIWKNWQLMSDDQKKISDEKCIEFTGMNNEQFNTFIMNNYWKNSQTCKLRNFDILHANMMKEYLKEKQRIESKSKYGLFEINFPIVKRNK